MKIVQRIERIHLISKNLCFSFFLFLEFIRINPSYSQVIRSLIQELLNRIHYGQIMAEKLEETTDLNDVNLFLLFECLFTTLFF